MKTLGVAIILLALLTTSLCGKRQAGIDQPKEQQEPGVGMTMDSANQNLDSTIKAADTADRRP